jgi:hypothetical protein
MKLFTSPILSYGISSLLIATASAFPVRNLTGRAVGDTYQFRVESEDGSNFGQDYEFRVDFQFESDNAYSIDDLLDLLNQIKTLVTASDCDEEAYSFEVSRDIADGETLTLEVIILGAVSTYNNQQNFPAAVDYQFHATPTDGNDDIFQFNIESSIIV